MPLHSQLSRLDFQLFFWIFLLIRRTATAKVAKREIGRSGGGFRQFGTIPMDFLSGGRAFCRLEGRGDPRSPCAPQVRDLDEQDDGPTERRADDAPEH